MMSTLLSCGGQANSSPISSNGDLGIPSSTSSVINSSSVDETVHTTSVSIKNKTSSLKIGETLQLEWEVLPTNATNKEVAFLSSAPDIVSVNKTGLVTANKYGTATLKVRTKDGEFTDSFDITVPVEVANLEVQFGKSSYEIGDTIDYTVNITPSDAADKSWIVSTTTPEILSIHEKEVSALAGGTGKLVFQAGEISKSYDIVVNEAKKYEQLSTVISKLESSSALESAKVSGGHWTHKELTDVEDDAETYDWTVYSDGIQKKISQSEEEYKTILTTKTDSAVVNLVDTTSATAANNKVEKKSYSYGSGWSAVLTADAANSAVSMITLDTSLSYDTEYGAIDYALNLLKNTSLFSSTLISDSLTITKNEDDGEVFIVQGAYSNTQNTEYHELYCQIEFEGDNLVFFEFAHNQYDKTGYDFTNKVLIDGAKALKKAEDSFSLIYSDRLATDEYRISEEDYQVRDFEIASKTGSNIIEANYEDGYPFDLNINVTSPLKYLDYDIEYVSDNPDVIKVSQYTHKLMVVENATGVANITVTINGVSKTIQLTVQAVPVSSLSITNAKSKLNIGDSMDISVEVLPENATDKTYTVAIVEGSDYATLTENDGAYSLTGVAAGTVKLQATSNDGQITSKIFSVEVKEKRSIDIDEIKAQIAAKGPYTGSGKDSISFNKDGTGNMVFDGDSECSFTWDISENSNGSYKLTISDISYSVKSEYTLVSGGAHTISEDLESVTISYKDSYKELSEETLKATN